MLSKILCRGLQMVCCERRVWDLKVQVAIPLSSVSCAAARCRALFASSESCPYAEILQ